jgi:hypothetical protein
MAGVLALFEVIAVLIGIIDKPAGIILRIVLVALLLLVVDVVAASVIAYLGHVPGVIITLTPSTKVIFKNDLEARAGMAVSLRRAVVTMANDNSVGREGRPNLLLSLYPS